MWIAQENITERVVSHILIIMKGMEQMSSLVKENLETVQQLQPGTIRLHMTGL